MSGFLGCGDLFIDRKINGVWQGYVAAGNATKFELKANSTLKQRISKSCNTYGQPVDSVTIQQPSELSISLDEMNRKNLSIVFLGDDSSLSVTGGTITAESHTVVSLDSAIKLASGNINSVVVKNAAGTDLTVDVDYVITNANVGLITFLSTGSVSAADVVTVDYVSAEITADLVKGGTNPDVKLRYLLVGKNLADQTNVQVEVWDSNASPQSGVDFLSDEYTSIDISGTANLDAQKGNAYEVRTGIKNA